MIRHTREIRRSGRWLLFALIFFLAAPVADAWQATNQRQLSEVDQKLRSAHQKLRSGKIDEVVTELEALYAERPGDTRVIFVLGPAYIRIDQAFKCRSGKDLQMSGRPLR